MNGGDRTPGRFVRWFWVVLITAAVCRIGAAWYAGLEHNRGDFYATLPGAYAQTLNPDLWNSPDLRHADGYQRAEYLYGPTQYSRSCRWSFSIRTTRSPDSCWCFTPC